MTPLVLLHAFPLDSSMYDEVRPQLPADWETLTPDLPGFGVEPISKQPPGLDIIADFVVQLMNERSYGQVILGGTSMGGYIAMAFARRHPERLAGLALIDTKASADPEPAAAGRRAMAEQLVAEQTTGPLLDAVFPKLLGSTTAQSRTDVVERVRTLVERCDPEAAAWAQRAMAVRPDSFEALSALRVPATVVVGSEDQLVTAEDAERLAITLPDSTLVTIPDVGHLSPIEAPEAVASALTQLRARVAH